MLALFGALTPISLLAGQTPPLSPPKEGIAKPNSGQNGPQKPNPQDTQNDSQGASAASSQPSAPGCDENCQNQRQNLDMQRKIEWFTGILAAVGVLQGVVLFLTWKAIRRQSDLQAFLTRQWVDVANFGVSDEDPREIPEWDLPKRHERPKRDEALKKSIELHSGFDVLNNTPYPLPLRKIVTYVSKGGRGLEWIKHEFSADVVLPPNRSVGDNFYSCFFSVSLDEREVELHAATCFGFQIRIDVIFLDAEGKEVIQQFHRWAGGGIRGFSFQSDLRAVAKEREKRKTEKAI